MKRIIFISFILCGALLYAHPHVFINNTLEIYCDNSGVSYIRNIWEFDEIFSRSIIDDYDSDRNGIFSAKENKDVYENAFINIKNFNFYSHVIFKGKEITHSNIRDFKPVISGNKLIYEFSVPLSIALSNSEYVDVCIYDDSYFIAFSDPKGKVIVRSKGGRNYSSSIITNDEESGYGSTFPSIIRVKPVQ